MVTIRARCNSCGEVPIPAGVFRLVTRPDGNGTYSFRCPQCRAVTTRDGDERVVALLRSGGVKESAATPRPGRALTEDDLIAFGLALERDTSAITELDTLVLDAGGEDPAR